jgi:putative Mn2+ efflux pump MntP
MSGLTIPELLLIALGLSADAFAVAMGNGLSMERVRARDACVIALAFGMFQAFMPVIGYALGSAVAGYIERFDHIIALILLGYIGGKMILEGLKKKGDGEVVSRRAGIGGLLIQAVATSIDALVVGVSFAAMGLTWAGMTGGVSLIGAVTFLLSFFGVFLGRKFGGVLGRKAEVVGGVILVGIGVKICIEHMFFSG